MVKSRSARSDNLDSHCRKFAERETRHRPGKTSVPKGHKITIGAIAENVSEAGSARRYRSRPGTRAGRGHCVVAQAPSLSQTARRRDEAQPSQRAVGLSRRRGPRSEQRASRPVARHKLCVRLGFAITPKQAVGATAEHGRAKQRRADQCGSGRQNCLSQPSYACTMHVFVRSSTIDHEVYV